MTTTFYIPNEADAPVVPGQAEPDSVDFKVIAAGSNLEGVLTGCAVTQRGAGANMSVDVAAGTGLYQSVTTVTIAGGNVVISAASATLARYDLIYFDNTGAIGVITGTPASTPVFPVVPANRVILAAVYVAALAASIVNADIIDKRMSLTLPIHTILSAMHSDTLPAGIVRGDVLVGNATPKLARVATGVAGSVFYGDGTDSAWTINPKIAGYVRAGSASVPNNTTAGDLTVLRAMIGTQEAIPTGVTSFVGGNHVASGYEATRMAYTDLILADGPIYYWPMSEASGNLVSSSDTLSAIANGGLTYSQPGPIAGSSGTGILFNGTTGYFGLTVVRGNNNTIPPTSGFTFECWVKRTSVGTVQTLFGQGTNGWTIRFNAADQVEVVRAGGGTVITSAGTVGTGAYHHIVVSVLGSGSTSSIYIDGARDSATAAFVIPNQTLTWNIGREITGANQFFDGTMAHAALYDYGLSPGQVARHYAAASSTPVGQTAGDATFKRLFVGDTGFFGALLEAPKTEVIGRKTNRDGANNTIGYATAAKEMVAAIYQAESIPYFCTRLGGLVKTSAPGSRIAFAVYDTSNNLLGYTAAITTFNTNFTSYEADIAFDPAGNAISGVVVPSGAFKIAVLLDGTATHTIAHSTSGGSAAETDGATLTTFAVPNNPFAGGSTTQFFAMVWAVARPAATETVPTIKLADGPISTTTWGATSPIVLQLARLRNGNSGVSLSDTTGLLARFGANQTWLRGLSIGEQYQNVSDGTLQVSGQLNIGNQQGTIPTGLLNLTAYDVFNSVPAAMTADFRTRHGSASDFLVAQFTGRSQPTGNTPGKLYGHQATVIHDAGAFNHTAADGGLIGGQFVAVQAVDLATVTAMIAGQFVVKATNGTATTAVGVDVIRGPLTGTGAFGTGIGLRIAASDGAPTTDIAIQSLGGMHRFVGNVKIGADSTPGVALDVTGAGWLSTYLRVGSLAAPLNTTAGDLTAIRFVTGTNVALVQSDSGANSVWFNYAADTTWTDTSNGAVIRMQGGIGAIAGINQDIRVLQVVVTDATSSGTQARISALRFLASKTGASTTTNIHALGGQITTTAGLIGTASVMRVFAPAIAAGKTVTTMIGLAVENMGTADVTNAIGVDIAAQSGAVTLNIGLRNAGKTVLVGNVKIGADSTPGVALDVTGAGWLSTYLRVGSLAAPLNTTAGDLTAIRFVTGTNVALVQSDSGANSVWFNYAADTTWTDTSNGAVIRMQGGIGAIAGINQDIRVLQVVVTDATSSGTQARISALRFLASKTGASTTTNIHALGGQITTTAGLIGTASVMRVFAPAIAAGKTVTTMIGLAVENMGTADVTNAIGVDIAAQSGAVTLNIGLRNAGKTVLTPSAQQSIAVTAPIVASATVVQVSTTTAANMTATPTIADGVDGQVLIIVNTGANPFTLQDQGALAGSNLRTVTGGCALGTRDSVKFMYSSAIGDWIQIGLVVNVV